MVALIVAVSLFRVAIDRTESKPPFAGGSGTLVVDDTTYTFTPTTCFISEEDFVAAGKGVLDTQQFWVTASGVGLDLAVGTENEIDQPADDQLWLVADDTIDWHATGQTIVAQAEMSDRRTPEVEPVVGSLELHCDNDGV
ncbi:MAG: hypothetical protein GY773_19330 [Actinomycetia bacterium]|nr:hypothetical protein [Actinomycetes bacterium]